MPLTIVSIASRPKLSSAPRQSAYASSMNSTPPTAGADHLLRERRGVPDVLADEVGARDLDELPARQHAHRL